MYWGIPPEVNAFRLQTGAGAAAHAAQIAAYTTAATTYAEQGAQQAATAAATSAVFIGPGGAAMVTSALNHTTFMAAAGAHAAAAATTITTAADAYAAALAATIPHEVVVANRVREAALQATNILGQNTPAIGEADAEYAEFWGQNASAMMGYLAAATAIIGALSVPLPPLAEASNPAAVLPAAAAAMGVQGIGAGLGAVSAGFSAATGVFSAGGSAALGTASAAPAAMGNGLPTPLAPPSPHVTPVSNGTDPAPATATPPPPPLPAPAHSPVSAAPQTAPANPATVPPAPGNQGGDIMQLTQPMMGAMTSMPSMLTGLMSTPMQSMGQLSSLMGPLSSLTSGMSGGHGAEGLPGASAANAPWSGLSGANGGFAGGGSSVAATLTKPSAGGGLGGPDLPEGWWHQSNGTAAQSSAGLRTTGAAGGPGMGPGMYSTPMGAAAGARRGAEHTDIGEADRSIAVPATAHQIPILTTEGVVYTGGGG